MCNKAPVNANLRNNQCASALPTLSRSLLELKTRLEESEQEKSFGYAGSLISYIVIT